MAESDIELIYERTCPNVDAARALIRQACAQLAIAPVWTEWESGDPGLPDHARGFGSPTILVRGHEVTGAAPDGAACCRIYQGQEGSRVVPMLEQLLAALRGDASGCCGALGPGKT